MPAFSEGLRFGASTVSNAQDESARNRERKRQEQEHTERLDRQKSQDAIAAEEKDYSRRKSMDFENPQSQAESMFRDRMLEKRELEKKNIESQINLRNRMPHDRPLADRGEQAVGAKLKYLDENVERLDDEDTWHLFSPTTWGGGNLSAEDSKLRESMKSRRNDLLRLSVDGDAPKRGKLTTQQQDAYMKARNQGKSEAEARAIAGG